METVISCSSGTVQTIDADTLWAILEEGGKAPLQLVDVRIPPEFESRHLPRAQNIPLHELDLHFERLDHETDIVCYSRTGQRSRGAAILLCNYGYERVRTLDGGLDGWPYQTVTESAPSPREPLFCDTASVKDILIIAIKMERASEAFYRLAAERIENTAAQTVLRRLAEFEREHRETLYHHFIGLWPEAPSLEDIHEAAQMETAVSVPAALLEMEREPPREPLEVYSIALEKECEAFDLYTNLAADSTPPLQAMFRQLAQHERAHIDDISAVLRTAIED